MLEILGFIFQSYPKHVNSEVSTREANRFGLQVTALRLPGSQLLASISQVHIKRTSTSIPVINRELDADEVPPHNSCCCVCILLCHLVFLNATWTHKHLKNSSDHTVEINLARSMWMDGYSPPANGTFAKLEAKTAARPWREIMLSEHKPCMGVGPISPAVQPWPSLLRFEGC